MLQADITMREIESFDQYCDTGHIAKEINNKPIRFFQVSTKTLTGVYCENCLILANYMRKVKKEINK